MGTRIEIEPKVSVIIPVYNSEEFLVSTLNSVISQTLSELEIICINDCSTDRSAEILSEFACKDKRVVVYTNAENVGAALSRNKGLERATGKYVTFMDSDDRLEPDMYEALYREALRGGYDVVKCDTFIHAAGKVTTPVYELDLTGKELRDRMIALLLYQFEEDDLPTCLWLGGVWNKLYRRAFLCEINIFFLSEREFSGEDFLFNLSVLLKTDKIQLLRQPLYHYNYHPGSLGASYFCQCYQNTVRTCRLADEKLLADDTLPACVTERLYYRVCTGIPIGVLNELKRNPRGKKEAVKEVVSICIHPFTRKAIHRVEIKRIKPTSDSMAYKVLARTLLGFLRVVHLFATDKK
ncbi:MAG: glycosyltransferase [Bacteroides sp.]|nr:glycosyltransferase [Bacteroides sp.]